MSSFTEPLGLEPFGKIWRTTRPLCFEVGKKDSGLVIAVPAGFPTDLASVPRPLWSILPMADPSYAASACLHDFLCRWEGFSRRTADALFHEALTALGVTGWRRWLLYRGVRIGAALNIPPPVPERVDAKPRLAEGPQPPHSLPSWPPLRKSN
jgi:hypothetical protein